MNFEESSKKVEEHLTTYFETNQNPLLVYHNLDHTLGVVRAATQIGQHYQLNERDLFIVTTAAWFHDVGYLKGIDNHEQRGVKMAKAFLNKLGVDKDTIQEISRCILATILPQTPVSTLEEIVCDADLFHFGTDDFWERSKLLRKEMENRESRTISKDEWRKCTTDLLINHHYFTDYAESVLANKKKENIEK